MASSTGAMQSPRSQERPYRSHLRPACMQCRRRKSRCKIERNSPVCLMCRLHATNCIFPGNDKPPNSINNDSQELQRSIPKEAIRKRRVRLSTPITRGPSVLGESRQSTTPVTEHGLLTGHGNPWAELRSDEWVYQHTPLSLDNTEQENSHIVGPENTKDTQVLTDYLSIMSHGKERLRMVRAVPASRSKQVLFSAVQKRPVGVNLQSNVAQEKLQIIEHLIDPHAEALADLYFAKINACLPLLDHESFKSHYRNSKEKISPALLASLYAHCTVYWRFSPKLAPHRAPDNRFIWNLANEVLYSELYLSPGISTITAILLNVGGRPTTSPVGNGVQLGAAVSLAHSLGLNRDPLPWDIPEPEKYLRMKIWWSLLIHDKWSSLAHGTPPRIQRAQHDVPAPKISFFYHAEQSIGTSKAAFVFIALSGLTEVLDHYLQYLYCVDLEQNVQISSLEFKLDQWVETLEARVRRVITRGTQLDLPGAANLRLSYLSIKLLLRRIKLENDRDKGSFDSETLETRYMQVRRTAEEIVLLVQELQEEHLGDFWFPGTAFIFPSTTTFLLRCALETEDSQAGVAQSSSLRLAWDLITALRTHRDKMGWDLGDICLAQYEEIVQKLMVLPEPGEPHISIPELEEMTIHDSAYVDELFPNLWDPLRDID